jgi:uncharacterized protein
VKQRILGISIAIGVSCFPVHASTSFTPLQWSELVSAPTDLTDPFADVPNDQYDALIMVLRLRETTRINSPLLKHVSQRRAKLIQKYKDQGMDLEPLLRKYDEELARRRKTAEAGVLELEGQAISLNGYMLPVTFENGAATEFMLLSNPGACSHSQLPLPNQTILVKPSSPHKFTRFFEPVTVQGTLKVKVQKKTIYLFDGTQQVTSAYEINSAQAN